MSGPSLPSSPRRHDLDALRASAMLLGIGFHVAHSLAPGFPWFIQDAHQDKGLLIFMYWVHGFRMGLFFLLSGFFTAMLWRNRGLGAMLTHRIRRIFLPLVLMCATIVPFSTWTIGNAMRAGFTERTTPRRSQSESGGQEVWKEVEAPEGEWDLWTTVRFGDDTQVREAFTQENDLDALHPEWGTTPLSTAALFGNEVSVSALLNLGANVKQANKDGSTALHSAAFMGRAEIVPALLEAGADPNARNSEGQTPLETAATPLPMSQFIAGMLGIPVEAEPLQQGRVKVREVLATAIEDAPPATLWAAILAPDPNELSRFLEGEVDLNQLEPESGMTPVAFAAIRGMTDQVTILIEAGADLNQRNRDRRTALHGAAFLGRSETVRALIDAGIDLEIRGDDDDTAADSVRASIEFAEYVAGIIQLDLDRKSIQKGRTESLKLLEEAGLTSKAQSTPIQNLLSRIQFSSFVHLWFLWFLCWLALAFVLYAVVAKLVGWKTVPLALLASPIALAVWVGLTMWPQWGMGRGLDFFGPDTSSELLPRWDIVGYYAIFFFYGALYFDSHDDRGTLGRSWPWALAIGTFVLFPLGLATSGLAFENLADGLSKEPAQWISVFAKAAFAWTMSIGFMGLFRAVLNKESKVWRYVSDSSYWLYIIHFPIVILVQGWMRSWDAPASLKFTAATLAISVFLFFTYALLVRHSPIGWMLNGKRKRQAKQSSLEPAKT